MKDVMKWVLTGFVALGAILAIVGISIDFISTSMEGVTLGSVGLYSDGVIGELGTDMTKTIAAFSTLTMIFAVATLVLKVLESLGIVKTNIVTMVLGAATVVFAIIALSVGIAFCVQNSGTLEIYGQTISTKVMPAAGAYLMAIGGLVAGVCGIIPCKK